MLRKRARISWRVQRRRFRPMISPRSQHTRKARWRIAFRLDLRRALLAIGAVTVTLALAFFIAIYEKTEKPAKVASGREMRTGSILIMPLVGDTCRQSVFDNYSGEIWPAKSISCIEAIRRSETGVKPTSHVMAISEKFRK